MEYIKEKYKISSSDIISLSLIIIVLVNILTFTFIIGMEDNAISRLFGGSDFKYFYNDSKKIITGDSGNIYNKSSFENLSLHKDKNIFNVNYSPVFYYLYIPLTFLPYKSALLLVSIIYIFLYIFSIMLLIKTFKRLIKHRFIILLFLLIYPPFIYSILIGQPAVLWIFFLCLSFYYAKKDMLFTSGLILSLFILIPNFYILIFLMLLFSFRSRIFLGMLTGSFLIIFFSGIFDLFSMWSHWAVPYIMLKNNYFTIDNMVLIRSIADRNFFYPLAVNNPISLFITYLFLMLGIFALAGPVIYSFRHKKNFSRNSYWLLLAISLVLSSPYLFNYNLIILLLPLIIFMNLLLADRVKNKYVIVILLAFSLSVVLFFLISLITEFQIFIIILWFILINGMLGKRIREYMPKAFRGYWENY
jgi:hypothetical protein